MEESGIVDTPTAIGAAASNKQEWRGLHVEDPLGQLGRSHHAAVGQARNCGVLAQGCWPSPFVLL